MHNQNLADYHFRRARYWAERGDHARAKLNDEVAKRYLALASKA